MKRQAGFTLVELVVVIIILGVLAATALPKFINVNSQAHEAAVAGTGGAFGTAVALVRAQWIANGHSGAVDNLAGFGNDDIDTNAKGWPVSSNGNNNNPNNNRCVQVWNSLLQNPPTVTTGNSTAFDYRARGNAGVCTYTYNGAARMSIAYTVSNGAVTVDNTP